MSSYDNLSQQLGSILENLVGGVRICNYRTNEHIYTSMSLIRYMEYEDSEYDYVTSLKMEDVVHPDDITPSATAIRQQMTSGKTYKYKQRLRTKNGGYKWTLTSGRIIQHDGEDPLLYILYQDIDEQERSRMELKRLVSMNSLMLESLSCGVFAYTLPEREHLILNKEARRLFGYHQHGIQTFAEAIRDCIFPDDYAALNHAVCSLQYPGDSVDYRFRTKVREGHIYTVACNSKLLAFPSGQRYILSVLQDITLQDAQTEMLTRLSMEQEKTTQLLEKERTHYRDALTLGSEYSFSFDVTDGSIKDPIMCSDGFDIIPQLGLHFPIMYNDLVKNLAQNIDCELMDPNTRIFLTSEGLSSHFYSGHSSAEIEVHVFDSDIYFTTTFYMFKEPSDNHIHALVLGRDNSESRRYMAKQKEDLEIALESERQKMNIIGAIGNIYYLIFHILPVQGIITIVSENHGRHLGYPNVGNAIEAFDLYIAQYVAEKYRPLLREFCDLSTLLDRLQGKNIISIEYLNNTNNWIQASFISLNSNGNKDTPEVLYVLEVIDDWKLREIDQKNALQEALQKAEQASITKSNFLANMSHEIRTPMNAVLGMADLALREEMSEQARDYIHQIKNSGKNLLVIINDILDYSKIESGKMDIVCVSYEPHSTLYDISNIVNTRIGDRDLEFTMDIDPSLPCKLYGDNTRIQQILINLLNNAVKFTKQGLISLSVSCEYLDDENVIIHTKITDTGSGIRSEDMDKLFQSFQQVDSKRNRGVEGTGLGLAISKCLLNMMGGDISVDSVYNQGSTFSFNLPQKIVQGSSPIKNVPFKSCSLYIKNVYIRKQLVTDLNRINIPYVDVKEPRMLDTTNPGFIILEECYYDQEMIRYISSHPQVLILIIVNYDSILKAEFPNIRILRKPVYSISLYSALNLMDGYTRNENPVADDFTFIAPEAKVLIVDDTPINLIVAEGLLRPLQMQVDTATSAQETVDKVKGTLYDVIFMDHMMPEVDGIETTHILRRLIPNYENVPIIALTANAIGDAKDTFLREGMNDFVAKPIEIKEMLAKLKKWLPPEKIIEGSPVSTEMNGQVPETSSDSIDPSSILSIQELDTKAALEMLGSEEMYRTILELYYKNIDKDTDSIRSLKDANDLTNYTIKVHSLKSSSKQIGATRLAELAASLENAGHMGDLELINSKTESMLQEYQKMKSILKPYFEEDKEIITTCPIDILKEYLEDFRQALEASNWGLLQKIIFGMSQYKYDGLLKQLFHDLQNNVATKDIDACTSIIKKWFTVLM